MRGRLELHLQHAAEHVRVAADVVKVDAMAPAVLDTEIDKADRAPDQVDVRQIQLLVEAVGGSAAIVVGAAERTTSRDAIGAADQRALDILMGRAKGQVGAQLI